MTETIIQKIRNRLSCMLHHDGEYCEVMSDMNNYCLCGRTIVTQFEINKKKIFLCPLCAYEIFIQTAIYNYSPAYMKTLWKAISARRSRLLFERNSKTNERRLKWKKQKKRK